MVVCAQGFQNDDHQQMTVTCLVKNMEKLAGYCANTPLYPNIREPG
jgi:hypothetical protein